MSKKKQKTKLEKLETRHNFDHLIKTKTAAKVIEAEDQVIKEAKSPLDKSVRADLRSGLITIGAFIVIVVVLWLLIGRNGEIFTFTNKIKFF